MKRSDQRLLKETMRKLQHLPGIEPHLQRLESATPATAPISLTYAALQFRHWENMSRVVGQR